MSKTFALWILVAPAIFLAPGRRATAPSERVQLTIGTLHAAALTTARAAGDSVDAPFFVVSVIGPHANTASMLPDSGQLSIRLNQALGARPLTELSLAGGDSIQVMVSVLENTQVPVSAESRGAMLAAKARAASLSEQVEQANRIVTPLVKQGAHWIGSASVLVTNEGGLVYWRRLDCVASCKVLSAPPSTALPSAAAQPIIGVVELSGNGGTYHLQLSANRAP